MIIIRTEFKRCVVCSYIPQQEIKRFANIAENNEVFNCLNSHNVKLGIIERFSDKLAFLPVCKIPFQRT